MSDFEIEVMGSSFEGEAEVSVTAKSEGLTEAVISVGLSPEEARALAAELRAQATHAEQWAAYRREQRESE